MCGGGNNSAVTSVDAVDNNGNDKVELTPKDQEAVS